MLNGNVSCTNGGTFTLTNSGNTTFGSGIQVALDGFFLQNGTGLVNINGTLTTTNDNVTFQSPVLLNGNFTVNTGTGPGDITFDSDLDGNFNLTLLAGTGDVFCGKAIGDGGVLNNLTIVSNNINLNGVGTISTSGSGFMNLTATNAINLTNSSYSASAQAYAAGTNVNFNTGALVTLNSFGGSIAFNTGGVILSSQNDLAVNTNNGSFSYVSITGTTFENLEINTGSGTAFMNLIPGPTTINDINVTAGQISLIDQINGTNINFTSLGSIFNAGAQFAVNSSNTASLNALGGDVGSFTSPILVNTSNQIFAGATFLANLDGTAEDNTVQPILTNIPCIIIFNGIVIRTCTLPTPTPPGTAALVITFPMPGMQDSQYNLASDYYFLPFFLDKKYFLHGLNLYYRP